MLHLPVGIIKINFSPPQQASLPCARGNFDGLFSHSACGHDEQKVSTKCSAWIGSPPSQPRKPKSQYAEIVVPLERFLRLYAGFRSSVRNLG